MSKSILNESILNYTLEKFLSF